MLSDRPSKCMHLARIPIIDTLSKIHQAKLLTLTFSNYYTVQNYSKMFRNNQNKCLEWYVLVIFWLRALDLALHF